MGAILLSVFAVAAANAAEAPLHLICQGVATTLEGSTATAVAQGSNSQWGTATVRQDGMVDHPEQLKLDFDGAGGGQILFPMTMMPPIHGGKNGLFPLRNAVFSSGEIMARTTINVFNQPRIMIDRITGNVTLTGLKLAFHGHCIPFDPQTTPRAF